jgi:hypothetical protein
MVTIRRTLDRGAILSALIISTIEKKDRKEVELEDISRSLDRLMKRNIIDLSDFDISPGGEYSDDVARFVGNYLLAGYAQKRSPLIFFPEGLQKCRANIEDAKKDKGKLEELKKVADFLGIDLGKTA